MNTQITRRAAMSAFVATAALPATAFAADSSNNRASSTMARLIDVFRLVKRQEEEAFARVNKIETVINLPALRVSPLERWNVRTVDLHSPGDIDSFCDRLANEDTPGSGLAAAAEKLRADLHSEFDDLAATYQRLQKESGLAVAQEEHEAYQDRMLEARDALIAHVPTTIEEYRERDAFLFEQIQSGLELDDEQLKALFSA